MKRAHSQSPKIEQPYPLCFLGIVFVAVAAATATAKNEKKRNALHKSTNSMEKTFKPNDNTQLFVYALNVYVLRFEYSTKALNPLYIYK